MELKNILTVWNRDEQEKILRQVSRWFSLLCSRFLDALFLAKEEEEEGTFSSFP